MQIRAQSIDPSSLLPMRDAFPPSSSTHLHAREPPTSHCVRQPSMPVIGNIRNRPRVWLSNAQMHGANDREIQDDQTSACWRGRDSVGGDRHAIARSRTRDDNETVVGAGGSPPAAHRRYSGVTLLISADPRSGRRVCRPQDRQRLPRLLIAVNWRDTHHQGSLTMKTLHIMAALLLVASPAAPTTARERSHQRSAPAQTNEIVGREVAAPPWSAACMTDHGPSECGEPMWIDGSSDARAAYRDAF